MNSFKEEKQPLNESSLNTHKADLNEIFLAHTLANGWAGVGNASEARKAMLNKMGILDDEAEVQDIQDRSYRMADAFSGWCKKNGYNSPIRKVWWTARPNILAKAVSKNDIKASVGNPTDVLVEFMDGRFLGISAKSTKAKKARDIGFKNPGIGSIERELKIKLNPIVEKYNKQLQDLYPNLSKTLRTRKQEIRAEKETKIKADELGSLALAEIATTLLQNLQRIGQESLRSHLLKTWLNSDTGTYPPYIKMTVSGEQVKIDNPLKSDTFANLHSGKIDLRIVGNEAIGVYVNKKPILKMRAKFESQKLASAVKFSGDPLTR